MDPLGVTWNAWNADLRILGSGVRRSAFFLFANCAIETLRQTTVFMAAPVGELGRRLG